MASNCEKLIQLRGEVQREIEFLAQAIGVSRRHNLAAMWTEAMERRIVNLTLALEDTKPRVNESAEEAVP